MHGSHGPSLVEAILETQSLKLIHPNAVVIGPRRKRGRVNAADLDSVGGELLSEAEAGGAGANDHHIKAAGAIGVGMKQGKIELEGLGFGLGFKVKKVAEFAEGAVGLEVGSEWRVNWGRGYVGKGEW